MPSGVTLSAGSNNGDGTWTLLPGELPGLTVSAPSGMNSFPLTVTAIAQEISGGSTATRQGTITVSVDTGGDILDGGAGNDSIIAGAGTDTLLGGLGNDTLEGGAGADTLDGGAGSDTASYSGSTAVVAIDLATGKGFGGDAQGDVLTGIENVTGSSFADRLGGNAAANVLAGAAGDDTLDGGDGNDTLLGGADNDSLSAGSATTF